MTREEAEFFVNEMKKVRVQSQESSEDAVCYLTNEDDVNHPKHYESGKFECIEVMEEAIGTEDVKSFCLCNAFKYIYRCRKKNTSPLEDIKKAVWYLNKFIEIEEYTGIKVNEHESHM